LKMLQCQRHPMIWQTSSMPLCLSVNLAGAPRGYYAWVRTQENIAGITGAVPLRCTPTQAARHRRGFCLHMVQVPAPRGGGDLIELGRLLFLRLPAGAHSSRSRTVALFSSYICWNRGCTLHHIACMLRWDTTVTLIIGLVELSNA
jgi:hypothetical protein